MLFMYMHTHPMEKCTLGEPEVAREIVDQMQREAMRSRVKLVGPYLTNQEHTVMAVVEGDDYEAIRRVMSPAEIWGQVELTPLSPVA